MAISAKDVMSLRQRTGLGMMECKKALTQTDGDAEAAIEILREMTKGKMDERTDRAASEGTLAVAKADDGSAIAIIELSTETDFTAKNSDTEAGADKVAGIILGNPDAEGDVQAVVDELRITTKENISCPRTLRVEQPEGGKVGHYLHHNRQVAAIVTVDGDVDDETMLGLCQHVAAIVPYPDAVDESSLPAEEVAKAKAQFIAEAEESGKPTEIAEKISQGRMAKWVDERTLLGQTYVKDPDGKQQVKDILPEGSSVKSYIKYQVGVHD